MTTNYNFKKFLNQKGVEMLQVFSPGKMCTYTEDVLNTPEKDRAKRLFTMEVAEIKECSKQEIVEDYINYEACVYGEEAENLYNQILIYLN